ncbi:hypothetical protein BST27_15040 [Mycobacterium intermedium]|uniref:Uncharacterized protein n=1 Tax=Mycobacterium intermedium TaxID=28445 RepID=A0A1E3SEY1_MYCIE|nr:hypothetical protein [Mycobacterium intermedium]MCV6963119.1 hypothetical protein [Mycobacterium intermedium]ODR00709.1 hypothetical protein BHQ20_12035 [Mycobacterium intermedium]OPE52329.1 hypothetical protein BV508_03020 [Mycobacterium intermedium]ORB03656.1 hypothetical protein BST27_15040 [Mycobacterium intermedium]
MTALAVAPALVAALCIGYHFGRRADPKTLTWKQRTSRIALGRRAIALGALLLARRLQHGFTQQHTLAAASRKRLGSVARQVLR